MNARLYSNEKKIRIFLTDIIKEIYNRGFIHTWKRIQCWKNHRDKWAYYSSGIGKYGITYRRHYCWECMFIFSDNWGMNEEEKIELKNMEEKEEREWNNANK